MPEAIAIARLELLRWLRRPSLWLLLAGISFILAFLLLRLVESFQAIHAANLAGMANLTVTQAIVPTFFQQGAITLLLLTPLLMMRSIAGEKHDHSWTLLQVSGLRPAQIVLGKMLGIGLLLTLLVLLLTAMPLTLLAGSSLDGGHIFSAALGVWLMVISFAAAGIFCSAIAKEPISAAMLHYGLLLLLALFHFTSYMPGIFAPSLYQLSPFSHLNAFTEARFSSIHLAWFLLFTALFLWLAIRQIKHQQIPARTRRARLLQLSGLLAGFVALIAIAIVIAQFPLSIDLSRQRINSPPPAVEKLLNKLETPLHISAVVADSPALRRKITKALAPYLTTSQKISLDFFTPEQRALQNNAPLNQEGRLEFNYGARNETIKTLGEADILRALQRLIEGKEQWIVFLEGHGEKSLYTSSNNGYTTLNRLLQQQGYHTQAINLLKLPAIPDNTNVLVLAAPADALLPGELSAIGDHLQRGGNLLLLRDPVSNRSIDTLLRDIGISVLPGTVIDANDQLRKLLAIRHPAIVPVTDFGPHPITAGLPGKMLLPIASALQVDDDSAWTHHSLLRSNTDSWNEISDLKGYVRFDSGSGEIAGPLTLGVAAQRQLDNTEQRAVAIGDSDFLSNEYIGFGDNARFALQLFSWLTDPSPATSDRQASTDDMTLTLSDTTLLILTTLLLLGLPLIFLLIALWQWRQSGGRNA